MKPIRWLNIEAYGATLEMWRNAAGKFFFVALGGTEEAKKALLDLGGKQGYFFNRSILAIHFPPIADQASAAAWLEKLPKAFLEDRPRPSVLLVSPGPDGTFSEAAKAAAVERYKSWSERALELEAQEALDVANEDFDLPGFADDVPVAAAPAAEAVASQPAQEVVAEAQVEQQVEDAAPAPAEPQPAATPVPAKSAVEQFVDAIHAGDDRPVLQGGYPAMPDAAELARIEEMGPSAAIIMSPWLDVFREVLNRMPEDSQAVLFLLGASRDRLMASANQFLAENPGFPLISAVWGSSKGDSHRLVLFVDATLPPDRHVAVLNEDLLSVGSEREMGLFLNTLWRDVYGQEDEVVLVAASVSEPGNAPDVRPGAQRDGAQRVHGAPELGAVEGTAAAGSGGAAGARAVAGPDEAQRSGGVRGAEPRAEQPGVHAGQPDDAGDAGRAPAGSRPVAGEPGGVDRELAVRGDERGLGADGADRGSRAGTLPAGRDGHREADQPVAGGTPAAAGGGDELTPVETGDPEDVDLAGTVLSAEDEERVRAEIEARRAERRRGMDLNFEETSGRVNYLPRSALREQGTMVPANMASAIGSALDRLVQRHGDLDAFVARQLGFDSSADLDGRLYAEQVDAVALALDAFSRDRNMVLGDLTGIGKGRVLASVLRYAYLNDMPTVFITKDQTLYNSMAREMAVLGMSELVDRSRMLITTTGVGIENDQGEQMFPGRSGDELTQVYESGALPAGIRVVFTCHSQLMTPADAPRGEWLRAIAHDALVLVDESHLSAGVDSLCGQNLRAIRDAARHTLFSSATSAKEGKNLSLYAGTDLSLLGSSHHIEEILRKGGAAAMEAVPMMLAQEGQYIRREHDMSRAEYRAPEVPQEYVPAIRQNMDALSAALRALLELQVVVTGYTQDINQNDYFVRQREAQERRRRGREQMGLSSMHFSSTLHHFSQQALLAVHADFYADLAIQSAREGNKPTLVLQSTMESILAEVVKVLVDNNVQPDGAEVEMSFASVLRRMAKKITEINVAYGGGNHAFNLQEPRVNLQGRGLPEQMQILLAGRHLETNVNVRGVLQEFEAALARIPNEIPVSPIDYICDKLRAAGYEMGELTGRRWKVNQVRPGVYQVQRRRDSSKRDRQRVMNAFNGGETTGIIINKAGATGIDLHADHRFADQRPRDMIVLQADDDIYVFQQSLGRVFRANMVVPPRYTLPGSAVPVAVRSMAIMRRRLSNMMSLTRGSRDAEVGGGMPDLFNWVGCEAAMSYLQDNQGVADVIGINLGVEAAKLQDQGGDTGLAARVTAMGLLLPCDVQDAMMDGLIRAYESKLEDLERRGINPFRSRHLDIKARVVNEVVLHPATGDSVFEGAVYLKELAYNEELPPLTPETVNTMIIAGREALSLEHGATRNWSRFPLAEVMPEVTQRMETRMNNLRDLFADRGDGETIEDLANARHESFTSRAARDYMGLRSLAGRIKLGAHLSLRLDSDAAIDFHIVGIEPPTWAQDMHSPYEWRLMLISKDQNMRQARVPLSLLLNEAREVQRAAFLAEADADPQEFVVGWESLAAAISDPARDLIDDQGQIQPEALAEYENLPRGSIEMRRHVLSGNLLKAIMMAGELHKGLPATYTLANGAREFGVVMPSNFDEIKLLRMPLTMTVADDVQDYLAHRLQSHVRVSVYMNLKDVNLPGVPSKDAEQARTDLNSNYYLEATRGRGGAEVKVVVPRAKGRSGWLVADEGVRELTQGREWVRVSNDLAMTFTMRDGQFPAELRAVVDRLLEVGVTFRTPSTDSRAREWVLERAAAQEQARRIDNQFDGRALA